MTNEESARLLEKAGAWRDVVGDSDMAEAARMGAHALRTAPGMADALDRLLGARGCVGCKAEDAPRYQRGKDLQRSEDEHTAGCVNLPAIAALTAYHGRAKEVLGG